MRFSASSWIGTLAFALVLLSLAGLAPAHHVAANALSLPGDHSAATLPPGSLMQQGAAPGAPATCALYDSWCAYCTSQPASDLCTTYPPVHLGATGAASSSIAPPSPVATARPAPTSTPAAASATTPTAPSSGGAAATVRIAQNAQLGAILTDAQGMTLYTRKSDPPGGSSCTGGCATTWPPFQPPSGNLTVPSGASGKLATITRDDGSKQVTYNGLALYYYSGDKAPGDTNGQGLNNNWFVVAP